MRTLALGILTGLTMALHALALQDASFREYPIGDPVEKNGMRIAAVWLPPVQMEGMNHPADGDIVHLEADIHAIKGNKNGFGIGEWVPYLTVKYTLVERQSKKEVKGTMAPMVAQDGPHYGASVLMPAHGTYDLTYELRPPSENGFGRHSDPITGVDPWWEPFTVAFTFDYQGTPKAK